MSLSNLRDAVIAYPQWRRYKRHRKDITEGESIAAWNPWNGGRPAIPCGSIGFYYNPNFGGFWEASYDYIKTDKVEYNSKDVVVRQYDRCYHEVILAENFDQYLQLYQAARKSPVGRKKYRRRYEYRG